MLVSPFRNPRRLAIRRPSVNMDEAIFKSNCCGRSFYTSLQEQKDSLALVGANARPLCPSISKEHLTFVHLVIHQGDHWAAVQITISPFSIQDFPSQTFYACRLRYTLCCQTTATKASFAAHIFTVVQRIYDIHYHPTQWDFSVERWYV